MHAFNATLVASQDASLEQRSVSQHSSMQVAFLTALHAFIIAALAASQFASVGKKKKRTAVADFFDQFRAKSNLKEEDQFLSSWQFNDYCNSSVETMTNVISTQRTWQMLL